MTVFSARPFFICDCCRAVAGLDDYRCYYTLHGRGGVMITTAVGPGGENLQAAARANE